MIKFYLRSLVVFIILGTTVSLNSYGINFYKFQVLRPDSTRTKSKVTTKITDTRLIKPVDPKAGVKLSFTPLPGDKILANVKVYPNPVSDYLNMTYSISKDSNVTIRIMDVLGNEITTLFSESLSEGEHNNTFSISSKISSGFYFVRVSVGSEIITKRISVL